LLQQGLKTLHIQLSEQTAATWPKASVAEPLGGVRRRLGDIGAR
jgi:hypothetical protein